jgi:hypothetical protein
MTKRFAIFLFGILTISCLTSCKTYYIPVDSFKEQFVGLEKTKELTTRGPLGGKTKYMAYPITVIKCLDKNGSPYGLTASPSLEIRVTYGDKNKRAVFYFDQISVNDTLLTGVQSRIIPSIKKIIPLNAITKIEIQDGRKKYRYVN